MKFIIEISGRTQPDLIHSLDEARKTLVGGGCFLNVSGCTNVVMKPASNADEDEFRQLYAAAHPRPAANWTK
jgi:hypothetical protein